DRIFAERLGGDGIAVVFGEGTVCAKAGGAALAAGIDAGRLVRTAAQASGGKGGGQPGFGRGGLGDPGRPPVRAGGAGVVIGRKKFTMLRRRSEFHSHYTVLDIGTEFVKALVVKREEGTGI